tara:strand:+ start:94 stop:288 length:195 start_codon:yes stop_codon:yes gene_type:complete
MDKRLENIEDKLDIIINKLNSNDTKCQKMSDHIDFVENIIKNFGPLRYLLRFNSFKNIKDNNDK